MSQATSGVRFALTRPLCPSDRALRRLRGVQEARHLVAQRGGVFRQLAGRAQHVLGGPARGVDRACDGVDVAGEIRRAVRRLADGACGDRRPQSRNGEVRDSKRKLTNPLNAGDDDPRRGAGEK